MDGAGGMAKTSEQAVSYREEVSARIHAAFTKAFFGSRHTSWEWLSRAVPVDMQATLYAFDAARRRSRYLWDCLDFLEHARVIEPAHPIVTFPRVTRGHHLFVVARDELLSVHVTLACTSGDTDLATAEPPALTFTPRPRRTLRRFR